MVTVVLGAEEVKEAVAQRVAYSALGLSALSRCTLKYLLPNLLEVADLEKMLEVKIRQ